MRRVSLRVLIAAAISMVSLLLTIAVSYVIGRDAVRSLEQQIGQSLALLADEMQDKLDRAMFERLQSLDDMTELAKIPSKIEAPASLRLSLERFQAAYSDYSWVGFADPSGKIVSATGGLLEGQSAKDQPWFKEGAAGPFVGEVKVYDPHSPQAPGKGHEATNFIDLAVPVVDDEKTIGVLGATLSADWAEEVKDTLLGSMKDMIPADVIVLTSARQVLFGPDELTGKTLDLPSIRSARAGSADFGVETWPDGRPYVTGFSKSDGYRSYPGLHWIMLVREDRDLAYAPVRSLQTNILISGAVFAIIAAILAWELANRLALPLLQLAEAAEGLRRGKRSDFPQVDGYDEARILSQSLRSMVKELDAQRASLAAANQSLESQVRERTQRLAEQNIGLERAKADAERATEAKSRFLAAASHDLRQPLHALTLFARALSRRVSGEEATTLVAQMEEGLRGLKGMFDALLNVSRLDARLIEPTLVPVSIGQIIERISAGSRVEAEQNGLRFLSVGKDWVIETDPALLETIIRNLVSNALKFTKQGGVILAARWRGGQRMVDVYDTGPGLSPERYDKIFEEFARTDQRAHGANDGLGLGLSIARRYADLLGMRIVVNSRQHRGSRFSIVLPSAGVVEHLPTGPVRATNGADVQDLSIMVLDDDPLIVSALCRDLRDRGNVAHGFERAADAELALNDGLKVDAAILDFDLRDRETGLEFIHRMSEKQGGPIPAVILSGGTDFGTLAALAKSGTAWLTKPADPELIVATLTSAMRGGHLPPRPSIADKHAEIRT
ncbi:hybrid sensor histidine kinase/response regulator [Hyphomicrobium methylovorum]|uniref:hybrid sensor histidine kinase/response regulator n=1 Tax=Hyphomicrobium methylovorum TaxID=84 RepID=UPI0015E738FA|nr:ATP-binding protein [Hyphomicrobium methylovorum]MBA2126313.1 hybrid sensor histidine kinase/response regulator [Hyphomicrobium methylovorum]